MTHQIKSVNTQLFSYFLILAFTGSLIFQFPFLYISRHPVPYIDGLFTVVSALCVTGLSTVDMSVYTNAGLVAILVFIEAGGLGLVTFFTVYLAFPSKKVSLVNRKIIRDYFIEDENQNIRQILAHILGITFIVQTTGAVILSICLKHVGEAHAVFYGLFLSISAFCNAGFAPWSDSLRRFSSNYVLCITISLLIIMGGIGFTVLTDIGSNIRSRIQQKCPQQLSLHSHITLCMTGILIGTGTIFIVIAEYRNAFAGMSIPHALLNAFFESVTLRTAGFETVRQSSFSASSTLVSILFMAVGGSSGSMAGGIKTTTFFLVLCYVFRSSYDKGDISVFNRDIPRAVIEKAVGIVIKGFCILFTASILLCISENEALRNGTITCGNIIFEATSAFGTVGLSKGITALLSPLGKIIIICTMFAGRTGIIALALETAGSQKLVSLTDYPHEDVLVG